MQSPQKRWAELSRTAKRLAHKRQNVLTYKKEMRKKWTKSYRKSL